MRLYLLTRTGRVDYDEAAGFVIRANHEDMARTLATTKAGNEGDMWLYEQHATCVCIGIDYESNAAAIILRDFRAG